MSDNSGIQLPAIPEETIGLTFAELSVDIALIPYLLGVLDSIKDAFNFYGDENDVQATAKALENLQADLTDL